MFNIFWLIQSIVSLIPRLSPSAPETTVSGFAFIVLVSMAKDAYEDYMRHRSDSACNRALVSVWHGSAFVQVPPSTAHPPPRRPPPPPPTRRPLRPPPPTPPCARARAPPPPARPAAHPAGAGPQVASRGVRGGDVVLVEEDEAVPADLVLLGTAEGPGGSCLLETANLDGGPAL
jgi:phospholipid-translocating ATPase